ncbi:hypothetical protein BpHYR1_031916, partial [Brachionus plicatilis]
FVLNSFLIKSHIIFIKNYFGDHYLISKQSRKEQTIYSSSSYKSKIETIAKEIQEYKLYKDINAQRFIAPFDHLVTILINLFLKIANMNSFSLI